MLVGVDSPDDCAVVRVAPNSDLLGVFSVDFFRSFYEDPYIFGQVTSMKRSTSSTSLTAPFYACISETMHYMIRQGQLCTSVHNPKCKLNLIINVN